MTKRRPIGVDVWDRLWVALHEGSRDLLVYVYRIDANGKVIAGPGPDSCRCCETSSAAASFGC